MFRRAYNISKPEDFKSLTADDFEGAGQCLVALTDEEMDAVPKAAQETVLLQLSESICKLNLPRKVLGNLVKRVMKMVRPRVLVLCLLVTRISSVYISVPVSMVWSLVLFTCLVYISAYTFLFLSRCLPLSVLVPVCLALPLPVIVAVFFCVCL